MDMLRNLHVAWRKPPDNGERHHNNNNNNTDNKQKGERLASFRL